MLNYGEELAYWYLRFNGFFLIDNFVLHMSDSRLGRSSDSDLLGIRLPHVFEEIGGQANDWDEHLFGQIDGNKKICLICEVKTGGFDPDRIFSRNHLEKAVGRFGISPNFQYHINEVSENAVTPIEDFLVVKVLFSRKKENPREDCIHIKLNHVKNFLKRRLNKYIDRKFNDRMFFPSPLIQYMAWEESQKQN
ncbi:hypothetical protein YDYSY3_29220 [Paenibacillus chitinolyticus]|uniref:hypothetical protein n=1 Tax=Paenibacillus chitinolyticus TaxID=79263 RepID=UPI0026E4B465|nr:hypothetical protein [Paenibacillus chitinolyticus]GKS11922.1 hypothetical protein YDYSY3_29220 [Paenibacillus chitinolyticus]